MDGDVFGVAFDTLGEDEDGSGAEVVVEEAEHPVKKADRAMTSVNPAFERRVRKITSRISVPEL